MTAAFPTSLAPAMVVLGLTLASAPAMAGDYADFGASSAWYATGAPPGRSAPPPRAAATEAQVAAGWLRRSVRSVAIDPATIALAPSGGYAPRAEEPGGPRIGLTRSTPVIGFGFAESIDGGQVEIGFGAGVLKAAERAPDVAAEIDLLKAGPDLRARGPAFEDEELDPAIGVSIVYKLDAKARPVMPR